MEKGRLLEDYSLNEYYEEDDGPDEPDKTEEPEEFASEIGEDYWDEQ